MIFVAAAKNGERVEYRDTKRYLWLLSLTLPLVPLAGVAAAWYTGAMWWMAVPLAFLYIGIPLLDLVFGEDANNPPEEVVEQLSQDQYYRVLLFLYIPLCYLNFFVVAWAVGTFEAPWWVLFCLTMASGSVTGAALTIGHELGHKPARADRIGAMIVNAMPAYGHFSLEHNRGHHTEVATEGDSASARMGESAYAFQRREAIGGLKRGLAFERDRLSRKGLGFWTWRNEVLQSYAITALIWGTVLTLWGWIMVPFLVLHTYIAWTQLTLANYVEHYGLLRQKLPNGRYEPCQPRHSWNTNHIVSNLMLFHLQRHSDHHANPQRPYQALRNFADLPRLPSGYSGCYVLASIPPLWFRIMDPKLMAWAGGDLSKVNALPGAKPRLT